MHKSSESIAAIAAALAKAQSALVNPEKTMTATIREEGRGQGGERSFRYAPLSAGLELVRNALGQHELAVVQTTSIDEAGRMVRLNTVLFLGLAGLSDQRHQCAASHGRGADLRAPLRPVHIGGDCWRGRP